MFQSPPRNCTCSCFLGRVAAEHWAVDLIGDRLGFKTVIWISILGVLPFTIVLPYANLFWTVLLTIPIGLILASAFSAMIVYAQEFSPQPSRHGCRTVFRVRIRNGRHRSRRPWLVGRPDQHRVRLSRVLVPAAGRTVNGIPAQYRATHTQLNTSYRPVTAENRSGIIHSHKNGPIKRTN